MEYPHDLALPRRYRIAHAKKKTSKNATKHRSRNASDAPTTRHRLISDGNAASVEALYAADAALHARHRAAGRGREPGCETERAVG